MAGDHAIAEKFLLLAQAAAQNGFTLDDVTLQARLDKLAGIEPSVRVSLGESMNTGSDFAFYTVQPKLSYELGNGWEPYVSVRYRDAFETSHDYFTRTFYLGAAYEVNKDWEIEPSYFHKNGVEKSNGIKLEVTRSF